MLGGPRVVRPRLAVALTGEAADAEATVLMVEREVMAMAQADAEAMARVLADRGAHAVVEARLRMLAEARSALSARNAGLRLPAGRHVQWMEPVSGVVSIPSDPLPRCLFAHENGDALCSVRGCTNIATGFFKVQQLHGSLTADVSFLCHDCGKPAECRQTATWVDL